MDHESLLTTVPGLETRQRLLRAHAQWQQLQQPLGDFWCWLRDEYGVGARPARDGLTGIHVLDMERYLAYVMRFGS
jgi:hypothetical protein